MPLDQIKQTMGRHDFDIRAALESHKEELRKRMARMERLIITVDQTLLHLKGKKAMSEKQYFQAFSDEQQAEYEQEALQRWDPATVKAASRRWKDYTAAEKRRIQDEGNALYQDLVQAMPHGAASAAAQSCVERWRRQIGYFWVPKDDQLLAWRTFITKIRASRPTSTGWTRAGGVHAGGRESVRGQAEGVEMAEEIYPMPAFVMLMVNDLEASSTFYQSALDFKHIFTMPGPGGQPDLVHLRWIKYADVLLTRPRDSQAPLGMKGREYR